MSQQLDSFNEFLAITIPEIIGDSQHVMELTAVAQHLSNVGKTTEEVSN